jgi:hypothetical protein
MTPSQRANDARTRFDRTVQILRHEHENATTDEARWLYGYLAEELLWNVLWDAKSLLSILNPDSERIEYTEQHAKNLASGLRAHRLAAKLADTTGRTPEEAEAFEAKAEAMFRESAR